MNGVRDRVQTWEDRQETLNRRFAEVNERLDSLAEDEEETFDLAEATERKIALLESRLKADQAASVAASKEVTDNVTDLQNQVRALQHKIKDLERMTTGHSHTLARLDNAAWREAGGLAGATERRSKKRKRRKEAQKATMPATANEAIADASAVM